MLGIDVVHVGHGHNHVNMIWVTMYQSYSHGCDEGDIVTQSYWHRCDEGDHCNLELFMLKLYQADCLSHTQSKS